MKFEDAVECLCSSIESERVAQGYLVVAPPRREGSALAIDFLQRLYCEVDESPCGGCRACKQVRARTHPDILWVEPQKKSRVISIGQVRSLQSQINQTSLAGGWKACIIVGADRLNPAAANAFLKTLEEPPGRTIFMLLSDSPNQLLPTVLSRCQRVTISAEECGIESPWREELFDVLAEDAFSPVLGVYSKADRIVRLLEGLKAAAALEEDAEEEEAEDDSPQVEKDAREARISARYREKRTAVLRSLMLWYRDLMLCAAGSPERVRCGEPYEAVLRRQGGELRIGDALRNIRLVEMMVEEFEKNVPEAQVLSVGLGRIAEQSVVS